MRVRRVRHKGLLRFIEDDDAKGIRNDLVSRVRRILTALVSAGSMERLEGPPGWRIHQLAGDRAGTWSLSVSGKMGIPFTQVRRGGDRRSCDMGQQGRQPPVGRGDERAIPELVSAGG